jgi:hypothetical protein
MLSIIAGSTLTVFSVSSIVSLVGFSASNRVAVSAQHKQEGEAILQRHEAAINARLEHAAWLRRTSVDGELPKAERTVSERSKPAAEQPLTVGASTSSEPAAEQSAESADSPREQGEDSRRHRQRPADSQRLSQAVDNLSERKQRQAVRKFFRGNSGVTGIQGRRDRSLRRLS